MSTPIFHQPLTRARAFQLAWPMFLANAAVPLASVVDTGVIGAVGDKVDLGGVALGATLFNVLYWSFYFLRMSSTGLAAQAEGAGDRVELERILIRAVGLALALGALSLLLRGPFAAVGFQILQGGPRVEEIGGAYFRGRSWGAPGAYATFALTGWLIGIGRTGPVLVVQLVFSLTNILLDLWFVLGLGWGVSGVAWATAIADTVAALVSVGYALGSLRARGGWAPEAFDRAALWSRHALGRLLSMNTDMMIRSWALLIGFAWFANAGAKQGAATLAGNHVLLQIVTVWAFVLDAYAYTAEAAVGQAIGARSREAFSRAVRITTELAVASGAVFLVATMLCGPWVLERWIADPEARDAAIRFLPYSAAIPLIGAAAWQLDGIFVGAMAAAAMRNASLWAVGIYIGLDRLLSPLFGPHGMWLAFVGYYLSRAGALMARYRSVTRAFR